MARNGASVPTATTWLKQDGHCYVVDSCPYALLKAQLAALPGGQGKGHGLFKPARDLKTMLASAPRPSSLASPSAPRAMSLAKAGTGPRRGLLLDYILLGQHCLNIDFGETNGVKTGPAAVGTTISLDHWTAYYAPGTELAHADGPAVVGLNRLGGQPHRAQRQR